MALFFTPAPKDKGTTAQGTSDTPKAPPASSKAIGHPTPSPPKKKPAPAPAIKPASTPEGTKEYTILDAIHELVGGRKGTLMLMGATTGIGYQVTAVYEDGRVSLLGPHGMTLRPKIGQREVPLYVPVWRD